MSLTMTKVASCDGTPWVMCHELAFDAPQHVCENVMKLLTARLARYDEGLKSHLDNWFTLAYNPNDPKNQIPKGCCRLIVSARPWRIRRFRSMCEIAAVLYSQEKRSAYIRKMPNEKRELKSWDEKANDFGPINDEDLERELTWARSVLEDAPDVEMHWY